MECCFPDSYTHSGHRYHNDGGGAYLANHPISNEAQQVLDVRGSHIDRAVRDGERVGIPIGLTFSIFVMLIIGPLSWRIACVGGEMRRRRC